MVAELKRRSSGWNPVQPGTRLLLTLKGKSKSIDAKSPSSATLIEVPGCGHAPALNVPDQFELAVATGDALLEAKIRNGLSVPYGFLLERARAAIARSAGVSWSMSAMCFSGSTLP